MTLRYILNYMITDFLLDQKKEMARIDKLCGKIENIDRRLELKEHKQYIYNQGLQALRRNEDKIPECVKTFFLLDGPEPTVDEVMTELKGLHTSASIGPKRLGYWLIVIIVIVLTLLAIFL